MTKLILLFITACTLFCSITDADAQRKNYIITLQGDTLNSEFKTNLLSQQRYKAAGMAEYEKVDATKIKQYHRKKDKNPYRSVILPENDEPQFMELLEEGKINLYQRIFESRGYTTNSVYHGGYTNVDWFVSKGKDSVEHLKTNSIFSSKSRKERKAEFEKLLEDNPEVLKYFRDTDSFEFDWLRRIIHYYNTGVKPTPPSNESVQGVN